MFVKRKYSLLRRLRANQRMSVSTFWMEVGTRVISYLCAVVVMTMILSVAVPAEVEQLNQLCILASVILAVLWCIPFIRLTRMRLRDAGLSTKTYFWLLLPFVGWIVFAGLMCVKGKPQTSENATEVL